MYDSHCHLALLRQCSHVFRAVIFLNSDSAYSAVFMQPSCSHFCSACKLPMQRCKGDAHGFVQERASLMHDSHSLLALLQQCQHIFRAVIFRNSGGACSAVILQPFVR